MDKILLKTLQIVLTAISPEIKTVITNAMNELEAKAKQTPNKFDDLLVMFLKAILS